VGTEGRGEKNGGGEDLEKKEKNPRQKYAPKRVEKNCLTGLKGGGIDLKKHTY